MPNKIKQISTLKLFDGSRSLREKRVGSSSNYLLFKCKTAQNNTSFFVFFFGQNVACYYFHDEPIFPASAFIRFRLDAYEYFRPRGSAAGTF